MTTLAAVRRDRRGVRKLRKALGRAHAELSLVKSTMSEEQRRKLAAAQDEASERLTTVEAKAGAEKERLRSKLAALDTRFRELTTVRGALRVLWRRLIRRPV